MSAGGNNNGSGKKLRSRAWFDNPDNPDMTALYLERYLNFGISREELQSGKPIIGIAQTGSDLSPCNRHHIELAKRVREGIREAGGSPSSFPFTPSRRRASGLPPRSTATSPISASSRCSTAIRSTAWC
jgi:dihydroxy-acid dehydratase